MWRNLWKVFKNIWIKVEYVPQPALESSLVGRQLLLLPRRLSCYTAPNLINLPLLPKRLECRVKICKMRLCPHEIGCRVKIYNVKDGSPAISSTFLSFFMCPSESVTVPSEHLLHYDTFLSFFSKTQSMPLSENVTMGPFAK